MSVLKYKLDDGTWREVATIRGERGQKGDTGPAGHTPTDEELTELITPIVQQQLGAIENGTY